MGLNSTASSQKTSSKCALKQLTLCLLMLALALGAYLSHMNLSKAAARLSESTAAHQEMLYLPNGDGLELISFGYKNFLSDILWIQAIDYFGQHYKSDRDYRWLAHMCQLVTTLDPRAKYVYSFCSNMLAWEAGNAEESIRILDQGIRQFPHDWELLAFRGFTYLFFIKDHELATRDLLRAAKLPDAPVLIQRLAAKKLAIKSPETAISFLQDMIRKAQSEPERKALNDRLLEALFERDARVVEQALRAYELIHGQRPDTLEALITAKIVPHLQDPYGGKFVIEEETGKIVSSTGKKADQVIP